jgi:CDP-diacylglycerol pyrophosphatase
MAMVIVALIGVTTAADAHEKSAKQTAADSVAEQAVVPTGRDALRQIVQNQCVAHWRQSGNPAPCERVFLPDPKNLDFGYAVLPDRKGAAHYLLIPTQTMAGTESRELLDPDLPNYFAEAWNARDVITKFVGHPVPRSAIGLAINNAHSRSQDQFHIHMECLRPDVYATLQRAAETTGDAWSALMIDGSTYQAIRIMGEGLDGANLFELLAALEPGVRRHMGDYTLVAAGMQFRSGPGFIVLTGTGPTGELLLDASCVVAGAGG